MPAPVPPQAAQELAVRAVPCPACGAQEKETAVAGLQGFHDLNSPQRFSFSRCRACALVFLDPRPLNLDEVYLEDYGKHHARGRKAPGLRSYSRRLLHRVFQDYPPPVPAPLRALLRALWAGRWKKYAAEHGHMCVPWAGSGLGRLLDVGSGAGDKVVKYTHLGWRVTGVETDAQAAAQAREYHALDVRAGYLHDQRFPGASFDAVTLLFVLEHVPAPVELLREVHRILAPGGALLIDVPNFDSALRETFGAAWSQYAIPEHWLLPTEATLRGMAERAGFQVESVRHRASRSLYKVCLERARRLGALDPELPTADADIERWLERRAAAPRGDLMLLLARKPGTP